jgi:hypothetical protein
MKLNLALSALLPLLIFHPPALAAEAPSLPAPVLADRNPVSLLPGDLKGSMKFRDDTESTPPATGIWSKDGILRVENFDRPRFADHVSGNWTFRQSAKRGDVVLARFFARAEYAKQESGEAAFEFIVRQDQPTYVPHVKLPLTAGPDWALLEIPFVIQRDVNPDQVQVQLAFGTIPQAVQIAHFELLNFGDRVKLSELPQTRFTYKGREDGAAWREAALERIEKYRTAPIAVRVIDGAGKPVPDARVEIKLKRPEFLWATSVDSGFLLDDTPDASKYRETLLEMFDTATIENGFKWPKWSGSVATREEALRASDWIQAQGLRQRGHPPRGPATSSRQAASPPCPHHAKAFHCWCRNTSAIS